jgi:hypothetical protein
VPAARRHVGQPVVDRGLAPGDAGLELLVDRAERHDSEQDEESTVEWLLGRPGVTRREPQEHAEPGVLEDVRDLVAEDERAGYVEPGLGAEEEDHDDVAGHHQPASGDSRTAAPGPDLLRHRRPP